MLTKRLIRFFLLTALCVQSIIAFAQVADSTNSEILKDDPSLAALDSMFLAKWFESSEFTTDTSLLNFKKWDKDEIPEFDDEHYRQAFKKMDAASPFNLVYNKPVKNYIDAYAKKNREKVARMLGLAELYFPMFEEILVRYNLPL